MTSPASQDQAHPTRKTRWLPGCLIIMLFAVAFLTIQVWLYSLSEPYVVWRLYENYHFLDIDPSWQRVAVAGDYGSRETPDNGFRTGNHAIEIWKTSNRQVVQKINVFNANSAIFSRDGTTMAGTSEDDKDTIHIWRISDGKVVNSFSDHQHKEYGVSIFGMALNYNGTLFASVDGRSVLRLWDIKSGSIIYEDKSGGGISFSPDGQFLVIGGNTTRIMRISDHSVIYQVDEAGGVSFSDNGQFLLVDRFRQGHNLIEVMRADDHRVLFQFAGDNSYSYHATLSPDGGLVAIVSSPSGGSMFSSWRRTKTELWRVSDGQIVQRLDAAYNPIFSPDGRLIASTSDDNTFKFWRVAPRDPRWAWLPLVGIVAVLGWMVWPTWRARRARA